MINENTVKFVNAALPGKVVEIKANAGDLVKKGDLLLIIEAMKMFHRILAPFNGTVKNIEVKVGALVENSTPLVSLIVD